MYKTLAQKIIYRMLVSAPIWVGLIIIFITIAKGYHYEAGPWVLTFGVGWVIAKKEYFLSLLASAAPLIYIFYSPNDSLTLRVCIVFAWLLIGLILGYFRNIYANNQRTPQ